MNCDKKSKSEKNVGGGGDLGGWGQQGGWGRVLKPKQYARLSNEVIYKKSNHLHNVEHVVQTAFQNMIISFKQTPYNSNFEFSSK